MNGSRILGMLNLDFWAVALKRADTCAEVGDLDGYAYWSARADAIRAKMDAIAEAHRTT